MSGTPCKVALCGKPVDARGLCSGHYATWRRNQPGRCRYCGGHLATKPYANGRTHDSCLERRRELWHAYTAQVIDGYGGKCNCCGETTSEFLTIDHVDGGGAEHRRSLGYGNRRLLLQIISAGFPPEFQVQCFNCNCGRQRNGGICPHVTGSTPSTKEATNA